MALTTHKLGNFIISTYLFSHFFYMNNTAKLFTLRFLLTEHQ